MIQVQYLAVLLSLVLNYFSVSGFSFDGYSSCNVYPGSDGNGGCEHGQQNYCGDAVFNLKSPFRFEGDKSSCNYPEFELSCRHNRTVLPVPSRYYSTDYYYYNVDSIDYENGMIRVIDPGLQKDDCSTLPLYSWEDGPSFYAEESADNQKVRAFLSGDMEALAFVSCKKPVKSKSKSSTSRFPLYVDTASCNITQKNFYKINSTDNFLGENEQSSPYTYAVVSPNLSASDIQESCTIHKIVPAQIESLLNKTGDISFQEIHNLLAHGFLWPWYFLIYHKYHRKGFVCHLLKIVQNLLRYINTSIIQSCARIGRSVGSVIKLLVLMIAARNVIGILLLIAFLIYKWSRRHLSMYDNVEEFLQANNGLMPIRYSYKEIKSMTKSFKEKLGEGGYGLVYKGKLRSGNLVAVKMLSKSKANGQEFINEVATIGRIHHVNVVRLVGFCVTNSKRALVYDYMPNGSLDNFIFSTSSNAATPLSWKKAFEIAMGVARGIEYLHQGCNMQILHFDIKPHNILLDENFVPKVSDFGLAKLYPIQDGHIATLTAARGTLGYMAPELFYKNIGRVSYKADVYSFGMLLMEMAGRRKNVNAHAEHSSQIYFPSWIYDKIAPTEDMEIFGSNATDEEKGMVRKLILIALWCIQMIPTDRPSMREVIEMLEGDIERMQLPPKPLLYPPDSPLHIQNSYTSSEESTEPLCRSITLEIEQINN